MSFIEQFEQYNIPVLINGVKLPLFKIPKWELDKRGLNKNISDYDFLAILCQEGMEDKVGKNNPRYAEYEARLNQELSLFKELEFCGYALITWDIIRFCREKEIGTGYARGSAAGSLVLYLIDVVSHVDPIQNNLYFERFLSKARAKFKEIDGIKYYDGSLLFDVDLDIDFQRRGEVIKYLEDTYKNRTAKLLTVSTLSSKILIKEIVKLFLMKKEDEANIISEMIPKMFGKVYSIDEAIEESKDFAEFAKLYPEAIEIAKKIHGLYLHYGVHPSAVVLSSDEIGSIIPLKLTKDKDLVTAYSMDDTLNLACKVDILGLRAVTLVQSVCNMVGIKSQDIDLNDSIIYENLQNLTTPHGLFQIEAETNYNVLKKIKPRNLEDLSAIVAIARPGALQFVEAYSEYVKTGKPQSIHSFFDDVFKDSGGLCIEENSEIFSITRNQFIKIKDINEGEFIETVNENDYNYEIKKVKNKLNNGLKSVIRIDLNTGDYIEVTEDHKFLTERGWIKAKDLKIKEDFIAVSSKILKNQYKNYSLDKLRVLGYLIGDGDLGGSSAAFICKNKEIENSYISAIEKAFPNLLITKEKQIRNVTRIKVKGINKTNYHDANSLTCWLRKIGLKDKKGGVKSWNKFLPEFVFNLSEECICVLLAALWDCDGSTTKYSWYYKTISKELAYGIKKLLLMIGIPSFIYKSSYTSIRGERTAYQITIYNTKLAFNKLAKYLVTYKHSDFRNNIMTGFSYDRSLIIDEINKTYGHSWKNRRDLYKIIGYKKKCVLLNANKNKRLNSTTAREFCNNLNLPIFHKNSKINFAQIKNISISGVKRVYDLEIEDNHNFFANNILVHNCLYQESLMRAANKLGFSLDEAEQLRRIIGKKKTDQMPEWEAKVYQKCKENNIPDEVGKILWEVMDASKDYSFNKSHSISYASMCAATVYFKFKYPKEFFVSLLKLSKDEPNPIVEVSKIYKELPYFGIKLLPPHILNSDTDFKIEGDNIRMGLGSVKSVSEKSLEKLKQFRQPHTNKFEIFKAANSAGLNSAVVSALILVGSLDDMLTESRAKTQMEYILWNLLTDNEKIWALKLGEEFKFDLIEIVKALNEKIKNEKGKPIIKDTRRVTIRKNFKPYLEVFNYNKRNEELSRYFFERELLGFSYSTNLHNIYSKQRSDLITINQLIGEPKDSYVNFVAEVSEVKPGVSKQKQTPYLRISAKDHTGDVRIMMFNTERNRNIDACQEINGRLPQENDIIIVTGKKMDGNTIFAQSIGIQKCDVFLKISQLPKEKKD